jgi:hypothetical protein
MKKLEISTILLSHNIHPPSAIQFLEVAIEAQKEVQRFAKPGERFDFNLIQGELLLSALKSNCDPGEMMSN